MLNSLYQRTMSVIVDFPKILKCSQLIYQCRYICYECSYSTCMGTGLFAGGRTMSLASFATESLRSSSSEIRLAGVLVLANLLQERLKGEELRSRIISSDNRTLLSTLLACSAGQMYGTEI